jgi:outer membrane protein assembly factor BamB
MFTQHVVRATGFALITVAGCSRERLPTEPRSFGDVFGRIRSCWLAPQTLWSWSRPVVHNNVVIFATGDRRLIARNRVSGATLWNTLVTSVNNEQRIGGLNLVARSGIVVAAVSRNTVGVDIATGQELWSYGAPKDTLEDGTPGVFGVVELVSMDIDDSTVYIPAWGASLSAVDLHTGHARWVWRPAPGTQFRSGGRGVRVSGDTLLLTVWHAVNAAATSSEGWVVSIDRKTGLELGRTVIPPYTQGVVFTGGPTLWRNLVIVGGPGGYVWAIDRSTHEIAWQWQPDSVTGTTVGGPQVFDDAVYADGGGSRIVALRAADGSVIWRSKIMTQSTHDLFVTDARVYVPESGLLNIIDRRTGRYIARTRQPGGELHTLFATSATAADRRIYIGVLDAAWCFQEP